MVFFLRRFGKAALVVEVGILGGAYYIFHPINTSAE